MATERRRQLAAALQKELQQLQKAEERMQRQNARPKIEGLAEKLEAKVPPKARAALERGFCVGFSAVFQQGEGIIEKTCGREKLQKIYAVQEHAVQTMARRKELRQMGRSARAEGWRSMALTTAEGVGLGLVGVGLPDIPLFLGVLMRGVYQTALHYGFDYTGPAEQLFILNMLEAALARGEPQRQADAVVEALCRKMPDDERAQLLLEAQLERTARCFASEMLALKFLQGLPLVGAVGGLANPAFYHQVDRYVQLKYRKRYLLRTLAELQAAAP